MDGSDDKTALEILGIIFAGDILYSLGLVSFWLVFPIVLPFVVAEAIYLNSSRMSVGETAPKQAKVPNRVKPVTSNPFSLAAPSYLIDEKYPNPSGEGFATRG